MKLQNPKTNSSIIVIAMLLVCSVQAIRAAGPAAKQSRRVNAGDVMPQFSGTTISNRKFNYKHGGDKVLVVAFLSADKKRSQRAAGDLENIVTNLGDELAKVDLVVIADDAKVRQYFQQPETSADGFHILLDTELKYWGLFGVIATPTVIISDANDNISWIKAGYPYDFAPAVQSHLQQILGIAPKIAPEKASKVQIVTNDTPSARALRHLQMARLLKQKGRLKAAVSEVRKSHQIDPNSVEVALEFGELLCQIGKAKEAIEMLSRLKPDSNVERARVILAQGWANRQIGKLDEALKYLLESTKLNPTSGRAFFELGRIYQAKEQDDKALSAYYRALVLIFGKD
jgi:tetratricopeptide (TPR) repeat protein